MVKAQTCGSGPQHRTTKSFRDKGESSPILQILLEGVGAANATMCLLRSVETPCRDRRVASTWASMVAAPSQVESIAQHNVLRRARIGLATGIPYLCSPVIQREGLDLLGIGESCCLGARVTTLRRLRWRLNFEPLSQNRTFTAIKTARARSKRIKRKRKSKREREVREAGWKERSFVGMIGRYTSTAFTV